MEWKTRHSKMCEFCIYTGLCLCLCLCMMLWWCTENIIFDILAPSAFRKYATCIGIPFICHKHHKRCLCKKNLPGVIFSKLNAKTQKLDSKMCINLTPCVLPHSVCNAQHSVIHWVYNLVHCVFFLCCSGQ